MNTLTFGIALWVLFGFMVAFAIAPRLNHSVAPTAPTPNEDNMNRNEYPTDVATDLGLDIEFSTTDAFCSGYARALLWADAYRVVHTDDCPNETPEPSCRDCGLARDEDAAYAYDSPGQWWEGMGIDFSDAVSFLSENMGTLAYLPRGENDWEQHGHDFLLTRNHHGAGFWDRGYPYEIANVLTENAQAFGEHSVLTDDSPRVTTL